jgi:hypothetical protein
MEEPRKKVKKKKSKVDGGSVSGSVAKNTQQNPIPERKSYRKQDRRNVLDDDDFSVAPSMDQDVKSVVTACFDDVYQRGRKVRKYKTKKQEIIYAHISFWRMNNQTDGMMMMIMMPIGVDSFF